MSAFMFDRSHSRAHLRVRRVPPAVLLRTIAVAVALCGAPFAVHAQSAADSDQEMTLEELEAYIAEQKAALEKVMENRDITATKTEALEQELAEREARLSDVEQELATLCEEREAIQPGSKADCLEGS